MQVEDDIRTSRWGARAIVIAALVGAVVAGASASGEDAIVERTLKRLADLDRDALVVPAAPAAPEQVEVRQHLAIARSIRIVESSLDTSLAVLTGDVLPLLSLARNYHHLGLQQRALQWYERAEIADKEREYVDEILHERTEVALALGDSSLAGQLAHTMLERHDRARWTEQIGRILGFYATLPGASDDALAIARGVEDIDGPVDADCLIEVARLHQRRDDDHAARAQYRALLRRESRLRPRQAALVLKGLADTNLAAGDRGRATTLYTTYREHDAGRLSAWATYQLAGLAATDARYEEAARLLRSICQREQDTPWREAACTRLAQIEQLEEIDHALIPYGRSIRNGEEKR